MDVVGRGVIPAFARAAFERAGIPFVPEAIAARIVEIEETASYTSQRGYGLRQAGIVAGDDYMDNRAGTVERAIELRLAEPQPDLIIVCRSRGSEALVIRQLEQERGLPRVPMLVSGRATLPWLLAVARGIDAGGACHFGRDEALLESVVRLGWPDAFARACARLGIDAATRPWRELSAPIDAPIMSEPHIEDFLMPPRTEQCLWAQGLSDTLWDIEYERTHPEDETGRVICVQGQPIQFAESLFRHLRANGREPVRPPARLVQTIEAGLAAGYLTLEEAAILCGDDEPAAKSLARWIRVRSDIRNAR